MVTARVVYVIFTFAIVALVLSACSREESPVPVSEATIVLGEMESEPKQVEEEVVEQKNCGGTAEAENEVSRSRSVEHTIDVGTEVEVSADGTVGVFGTGVNLGASVANRLGYSYGQSESVGRSVTVKAAPGTHMEHHISYQEVWKVGTAEVSVNGQSQNIPYKFRTDFKLVLLESKDINDCPLPSDAPLPTNTPVSIVTVPVNPTATVVSLATPMVTQSNILEQVCWEENLVTLAFEGLDTSNPIFRRPEGYTSGWVTGDDTAIIVLPDGSEKQMLKRFALIVDDLPEVKFRNVEVAAHGAAVRGCWFRSDSIDGVESAADFQYGKLKTQTPGNHELWRISAEGMEFLKSE